MKKFSTSIVLFLALGISYEAYASSYNLIPEDLRLEMESCGVDRVEYDRLLALSQKDFDQDFDGGWRAVDYKEGCANAAGEIIKAYILYSAPHAPKGVRFLRWHAGQSKAAAGHYDEAAAFFRGSYDEDLDRGEAWNIYVDATIAFIERDKAALQSAHDKLASMTVSEDEKASRRKFLADNPNITMPEGFVDRPQNMGPVKDLLICFDQPYSIAYGRCEAD